MGSISIYRILICSREELASPSSRFRVNLWLRATWLAWPTRQSLERAGSISIQSWHYTKDGCLPAWANTDKFDFRFVRSFSLKSTENSLDTSSARVTTDSYVPMKNVRAKKRFHFEMQNGTDGTYRHTANMGNVCLAQANGKWAPAKITISRCSTHVYHKMTRLCLKSACINRSLHAFRHLPVSAYASIAHSDDSWSHPWVSRNESAIIDENQHGPCRITRYAENTYSEETKRHGMCSDVMHYRFCDTHTVVCASASTKFYFHKETNQYISSTMALRHIWLTIQYNERFRTGITQNLAALSVKGKEISSHDHRFERGFTLTSSSSTLKVLELENIASYAPIRVQTRSNGEIL